MKNIFNVLIVVILVLTVYNTYKIHMTSAPENTSQSAFAESINTNAAEIQTLKDNLETMVNFVNAKFENADAE